MGESKAVEEQTYMYLLFLHGDQIVWDNTHKHKH